MAKYSNDLGISLPMAVWLARDEYTHIPDPTVISATGLMRPVKQILLGARIPVVPANTPGLIPCTDISSLVASRLGTAVHNSIESSWVENHEQALQDLGYPQKIIDRVVINPEGKPPKGSLPVYTELRTQKAVGEWNISGEFDFVMEGRVHDFKSTGTYTYTHGTNTSNYIKQMSIYRWLNPEIITDSHGAIQFIFTDWKALLAVNDPKYPKTRVLEKLYPLWSVEQTDTWVNAKLGLLERLADSPEEDMPRCTDEELWRAAPKFKYYTKPDSKRAWRSFDTAREANELKASRGSGYVKEVGGEVKACKWCPAASMCRQKEEYLNDGSLKL